jgi:hypothetical protein
MRSVPQFTAVHPLSFGRRAASPPRLSPDLRLFLWTYLAGFAFTSLWIA